MAGLQSPVTPHQNLGFILSPGLGFGMVRKRYFQLVEQPQNWICIILRLGRRDHVFGNMLIKKSVYDTDKVYSLQFMYMYFSILNPRWKENQISPLFHELLWYWSVFSSLAAVVVLSGLCACVSLLVSTSQWTALESDTVSSSFGELVVPRGLIVIKGLLVPQWVASELHLHPLKTSSKPSKS